MRSASPFVVVDTSSIRRRYVVDTARANAASNTCDKKRQKKR